MFTIDESKLYSLINVYKENFEQNFPNEKYKWEAVKHFQDNWDINAEDFPTMLSNSLSKTGNLLASVSNFPRRMIKQFADRFPEEVKELFKTLYNEGFDLKERIDSFISGIERIHKKWDGKEAKNHYHTFNVVSTYLWLRYPDKYYIYKPSVANQLFEELGIDIKLTLLKAEAVIKTYELYDEISSALIRDTEFKEKYADSLTNTCYPDEHLHTAMIDLGYFISKSYIQKKLLYVAFLEKFPYESLASLPIEKYTNLNKSDSFCYWLERKAKDLGSIAGGSSYKFGIYQYATTPTDAQKFVDFDSIYAWYKKYHKQTANEAYELVRDTIIEIASLARDGKLEDIDNITELGDVVKWKIAFIYSNASLIPIYNRQMLAYSAENLGMQNVETATIPDIQRYLLSIKGDKDIFIFYEELLKILESFTETENDVETNNNTDMKYWMYAPGENASKWPRCLEQNIMCIGWDELGELLQFNTVEEVRTTLRETYNKPNASFMNDGLALWEFSHVMQVGDVVYAKQGQNKVIGRGIVTSEYNYDPNQEDYIHIRKVEWTHVGEWTLENIVLKTLTDITKYPDYVKKIEAMITEGKNDNKQSIQYDEKYLYYINLLLKNKNLILNGAPGTGKTYLAKQIAAQIIFDGNVPEDFEENEMFINQYGFVQFHPSYDYTDFVEGLRPTPPNKNGNIGFERKDGIFKAFCRNAISTSSSQIVSTFQSIYDSIVKDIEAGAITSYQNRQGQNSPLRVNDKGRIEYRASENSPRTEKEENIKLFYDYFIKNNIYDISSYERDDYWNLIAELSNGSTKKVDYIEYGWILQELLNRTHKVFKESITEIKPYIFIIDEVNRGEISKIFGELFFAIDPGYRGKKGKVQTQYQNLITDESDPFKDGFYIPENVYIIGTMNDIDRSVECMDFAMRRRFTFKEITAEESAKNMGVDPDRMKRLNNAISGIEGFNSSFHIGAAYFRGVTDYEELWELKLQGLLKEYLRGMPDADETLNTLKKAYFKSEE